MSNANLIYIPIENVIYSCVSPMRRAPFVKVSRAVKVFYVSAFELNLKDKALLSEDIP